MPGILRISEAAVLAIHTAALLGAREGEVLTNGEMASFLGASGAHLSKVLQRLTRSGIVRSVRGPLGGFTLARPGGDVALLDVFEAIDGPFDQSECLLGTPVCDGECVLGDVLSEVNRIVRERLSGTRVCDIGISMEG